MGYNSAANGAPREHFDRQTISSFEYSIIRIIAGIVIRK